MNTISLEREPVLSRMSGPAPGTSQAASSASKSRQPRFEITPGGLPDHSSAGATRQHDAERLVGLSAVGDVLVVFSGLLLSFWVRFRTSLAGVGVSSTSVWLGDYSTYILMGGGSLLAMYAYLKVYDAQNLLRLRHTALTVSRATVLWFVGFLSFALMFKFEPPISRLYVAVSAGVVLTGMLAWRYSFHRILQTGRAARALRQRVLFVGWSAEAERLRQSIVTGAHPSHEVVGYVTATGDDAYPLAVPSLGNVDDVWDILHNYDIDVVILASSDLHRQQVVTLANLCEREMRQFKVIPSYFQILVSGLRLETISRVPVLGVSNLPLDYFHNRVIKRTVDVVGALVGLVLSAPIIALFSALVYLESSGSVFYRQVRFGKNGRLFRIIKIRSMRLDAEAGTGVGWTQKDDPRRLRIGAFMRKWNIDELPQFWNVLKGEMSLVGPRPERPELIRNFKTQIPHYNARHHAKAGITGWAQVKGLRGDTDLTERVNCDLFYLENWNLLLDFQIMLLTLFKRDNAC